MSDLNIERIITLLIFISSIAGVYFRMKAKVDTTSLDVNKFSKELDKISNDLKALREKHISDINNELSNCKVREEKIKGLYKILNDMSTKTEKALDQMRDMIIKLFDTKQDKK